MKSRDTCYDEVFQNPPIPCVVRGRSIKGNSIPDEDSGSYASIGKVRELTETKYKHLQQDFIPKDRCMPSR